MELVFYPELGGIAFPFHLFFLFSLNTLSKSFHPKRSTKLGGVGEEAVGGGRGGSGQTMAAVVATAQK